MNTFIKNVLHYGDEIKRSMSEGKSEGEKRIFLENMSLRSVLLKLS